jgi:cutinase
MSARQVARFLDGAAAVTACAALVSATIAIPSAFAAACPDVEVVFARATTEPPGTGAVGQAFVDSLRSQVGGKSVGVYAVNYPAPIPPEVADHVAAVAVFGNPSTRFVGPITAVSPLYGAKAIDLCNPGVLVCTSSAPQRDEMFTGPHVQYLQSGMPSQAAAFAASRLG